MKDIEQYTEFFRSERERLESMSHPLLNRHRAGALAALEHLGFPSRSEERYKYTDVPSAFAPNYGMSLAPTVDNTGSISDAEAELYGSLADVNADAITALNTLLIQDVAIIHLSADEVREHPLQITHTLRSTAPLMQHRRLLIMAEPGSRVQIILADKAQADQDFLTTQVTEIFVGENAHVELYDIEDSHNRCRRFNQVFARVAAGGHLTHTAFTLAGGISRNQTDVQLVGAGADVKLLGCAITNGSQHVDNNTLIDHQAPDCKSRELYKYVIDQQSTGAFAGRVLVRKEAQHTDSIERNANLVCTREARMWTQPMLEIYADDVKCSHGSTVGQLNADALLYMQQRGIDESEARMLLKQAFASEVLGEIPSESLRQRLQVLVEKRFRSCEHCQLCK